jgi:hypothetical protein
MDGSIRSLENSLGYSRVTINPETESMRIDVINVAEVSQDLRNVTQIFTTDTVFDQVELKKPDQQNNPRIISSKSLSILSGVFSCNNSSVPSDYDFSTEQIPWCILHGLR